jgi:hypothetical protein
LHLLNTSKYLWAIRETFTEYHVAFYATVIARWQRNTAQEVVSTNQFLIVQATAHSNAASRVAWTRETGYRQRALDQHLGAVSTYIVVSDHFLFVIKLLDSGVLRANNREGMGGVF